MAMDFVREQLYNKVKQGVLTGIRENQRHGQVRLKSTVAEPRRSPWGSTFEQEKTGLI